LQLSWLERKMAATLFAEPPSSSLDEAMDHFLSGIGPSLGGNMFIGIFTVRTSSLKKQQYSTGYFPPKERGDLKDLFL
jgi:hypothetical protein